MSIKVLIIDDSPFYRTILKKGIDKKSEIEVVAVAVDAYDATQKIIEYRPDVVTCDIEMPKIDGVSLIKQLLPQYPIPIIVVSSVGEKIFDAIRAGAIDYLLKADFSDPVDRDRFFKELNSKIISAYRKTYVNKVAKKEIIKLQQKNTISHNIIAIGASTGGTQAISQILKQFPSHMPPIVIVQHIPEEFSRLFANRLNEDLPFIVSEAVNGEPLLADHVYIAQGNKHLEVKKNIDNKFYLSVKKSEKVNGHCPSVDKLFFSVSQIFKAKAVGILLTGMGTDGALGLSSLRRAGAVTITQDEMSCVVYGMPGAAKELGASKFEVPLDLVASTVMRNL
jgi:two-component system chemotaxis response regulator CheB